MKNDRAEKGFMVPNETRDRVDDRISSSLFSYFPKVSLGTRLTVTHLF